MITIEQIDSVFSGTTSSSLQLHTIVNTLAAIPINDPAELSPVADVSGSNYLDTLIRIEATLSASHYFIDARGDSIGLTNDQSFNSRIGSWVVG